MSVIINLDQANALAVMIAKDKDCVIMVGAQETVNVVTPRAHQPLHLQVQVMTTQTPQAPQALHLQVQTPPAPVPALSLHQVVAGAMSMSAIINLIQVVAMMILIAKAKECAIMASALETVNVMTAQAHQPLHLQVQPLAPHILLTRHVSCQSLEEVVGAMLMSAPIQMDQADAAPVMIAKDKDYAVVMVSALETVNVAAATHQPLHLQVQPQPPQPLHHLQAQHAPMMKATTLWDQTDAQMMMNAKDKDIALQLDGALETVDAEHRITE